MDDKFKDLIKIVDNSELICYDKGPYMTGFLRIQNDILGANIIRKIIGEREEEYKIDVKKVLKSKDLNEAY